MMLKLIPISIMVEKEDDSTAMLRSLGIKTSDESSTQSVIIYVNPNQITSVEPVWDNNKICVVYFSAGDFVVCPMSQEDMVIYLMESSGE